MELCHNGTKKLETTSAGGTLSGTWNVGKVLQVIEASSTNRTSTTASTWQDTNLSTQITTSSTSSRIQIMTMSDVQVSSSTTIAITVYASNDGGSNWTNLGQTDNGLVTQMGVGAEESTAASVKYHPDHQGAIDYKVRFKRAAGSGTCYYPANDGKNAARIIVMEIAG